MEFKVLAVGDVVGNPGMDRICKSLRKLKKQTGADFVVVNGENASVVGITPNQAEEILDTIHSDLGTKENEICHCFHFFPSTCREVMGLDAMILIF